MRSRLHSSFLPKEERDRIGYLCFNYENRLLETDHGVLYPDVARTLESLSQKTDLYIVSNCQCGYIEVFLKTMGLGKYIKDFYALVRHRFQKMNPSVF